MKGVRPYFSILVVCLNPGEKLERTLNSIKMQKFHDYEVIVKDGGSTDKSTERVKEIFTLWQQEHEAVSLRLIEKKDSGIYDAMNQAAKEAVGCFVYYLNCGDCFHSDNVLGDMAQHIERSILTHPGAPGIYYGNIYERVTGQVVASNPKMDAFGCYRNVPCHQACFYSRELLSAHPFETKYKVRADYEQFLWCFFASGFEKGVTFAHFDLLIADYEGGGFSETKENRRTSAAEHREITRKYMNKTQLFKFKAVMILSLAPLRTWIARNEKTAGIYNKVKSLVYARRKS